MKVTAPPLAPILRSSSQGRLLAALFSDPGVEMTVTALADRAGVHPVTALREIERSEEAGLVETRKVGQARLVRANTGNRHFAPVRQIVVEAFGPPAVVTAALGDLDGVVALVLFGSWAARFAGEPGGPPNDLDILVLGRPDRSSVYEAVEEIERAVGMPVQVTFRSSSDWASDDPFIRTVKSRPWLPLAADADNPDVADIVEALRGTR